MSKETRSHVAKALAMLLPFCDLIVLAGCFATSLWIRFSSGYHVEEWPFHYYQIQFTTLVIMGIIWLGIFQSQRLYRQRVFITIVRQLMQILKGVTIGTLLYIFLSYILKTAYMEQSRLVIGYSWILSFSLLSLYRCFLFRPLYLKVISGGVINRVLIAGAGHSGIQFAESVAGNTKLGIEVVGFVDDHEDKQGQVIAGLPVLGRVDEVNLVVHDHGIDEIYIAISTVDHHRLLEIISRCRETKVPVQIISDLYNVITSKIDVEQLDGTPMVEIKDRYVEDFNMAVKRLIDVLGSGLALVILSPVLIFTALLIKITSPGSVFFKQVRIGKNGKRFGLFKFRSMVSGADDKVHREYLKKFIDGAGESAAEGDGEETVFKLTNDARVTRVGALIRKFSIDELPQLLNVLRGEMSLVGPRPCLLYEFDNYRPWHKRRFNVLPGITGLWQVSGRSSVAFNDMIMLDLYYIENMSLWFDLQIMFKTIPVVLAGQGGM